jgi:hypothetical protein
MSGRNKEVHAEMTRIKHWLTWKRLTAIAGAPLLPALLPTVGLVASECQQRRS